MLLSTLWASLVLTALWSHIRQYVAEERDQLLRRMEAGGAAGDDMLNPARETLRSSCWRRPQLYDKGSPGRERRLFSGPTSLVRQRAVRFTPHVASLLHDAVNLRSGAVEDEGRSVARAWSLR